jgi:urease accessory protein
MSALLGGLLHPLLTPAHVIVLVGLGLFAGGPGARVRWTVLSFFAAGLLAGLAAVVLAFADEYADLAALLCAATAGLLATVSRPVPSWIAAPLAAIAGAAIELDSVPDEISMAATMFALAGTAIAAVLALVIVAAIGTVRTHQWQKIGIRILGSWIAASAILVLALRLTQ